MKEVIQPADSEHPPAREALGTPPRERIAEAERIGEVSRAIVSGVEAGVIPVDSMNRFIDAIRARFIDNEYVTDIDVRRAGEKLVDEIEKYNVDPNMPPIAIEYVIPEFISILPPKDKI